MERHSWYDVPGNEAIKETFGNMETKHSRSRDVDLSAPVPALSLAVILGLMGAYVWAIRGTTGFGGSQGAALAGLAWAMMWYMFCHVDGQGERRPYGSLRAIAAITFGVALGGMTGYGVYVGWVQGNFYLNFPEGVRDVGAWTGYLALFICGIHWGGNAGAFLAFAAPRYPLGLRGWIARICAGIIGFLLAALIVRIFPQWFLPFYHEGLYEVEEYATCQRAVGSLRNIGPYVGLFLGFLAYEILRRDWRGVAIMLIMSLGFAVSFALGGYWHTFHGSGVALGWWKNWEMSIGLGGGLSFGLVFYLFNRPVLPEPRPLPRFRERLWGAAFPLWFVTGSIIANTWQGLVTLHGFEWTTTCRILTVLVWLIPVTVLLALWLRSKASTLPAWAPPNVLLLIIVVGLIVSLPSTLSMKQYVLLGTYTVCIVVSAELYCLLFLPKRQPLLKE